MTGTNWTSVYTGTTNLNGISVDASGPAFTGGAAVTLVDNMAGVVTSNAFGNVISGIAAIPVASPLPAAIRFSPASLAFGNLNIGTESAAKPVTITNFGGTPLSFSSVATSGRLWTQALGGVPWLWDQVVRSR
jgi:hypothetical protein